MNWIDKLIQELGLEDTVPDAPPDEISILEVVRRVQFTDKGWAAVRQGLIEGAREADAQLFRRILEENSEQFKLFLGVIKMPYSLGRNLKYQTEACEQLALLTAYALSIAMSKGYEYGRQSVESSGEGGSESPREPSEPQ